jgi:hypothetical protein
MTRRGSSSAPIGTVFLLVFLFKERLQESRAGAMSKPTLLWTNLGYARVLPSLEEIHEPLLVGDHVVEQYSRDEPLGYTYFYYGFCRCQSIWWRIDLLSSNRRLILQMPDACCVISRFDDRTNVEVESAVCV